MVVAVTVRDRRGKTVASKKYTKYITCRGNGRKPHTPRSGGGLPLVDGGGRTEITTRLRGHGPHALHGRCAETPDPVLFGTPM